MKLDETKPQGIKRGATPAGEGHGGYSPILNGKATGRYAVYETALEQPNDIVITFKDIEKFGYEK